MATYVLIHGAWPDSWYWHRVAPELRARGHDVVAPDLPSGDDSAGLADYADVVADAVGDRTDLVVVAHSLAGFTAPLVCDRVPVDLLVMLAAMIPAPGEPPGEWWANTGHDQAKHDQDERDGRTPGDDFGSGLTERFLHDLPPDLAAAVVARGGPNQSGTPFERPWPLDAWPDVPTRVLICRDDRFFPAGFMRRVAKERLGVVPDEMPGGHMPALSRPKDLIERLEAYRTEHRAVPLGPR